MAATSVQRPVLAATASAARGSWVSGGRGTAIGNDLREAACGQQACAGAVAWQALPTIMIVGLAERASPGRSRGRGNRRHESDPTVQGRGHGSTDLGARS